MKRGRLWNLIVAGCMSLALMGSAGIVLADADALVEAGKTELFTNQDLLAANSCFQQAWMEDNIHPQANFWYGLTRIAVLIQSDETVTLLTGFGFTKNDDTALDQDALNPFNLDIKPPLDLAGNIDLPSNSPTFTDVQDFFKNTFLAEVDSALSENLSQLNYNSFIDYVDMNTGGGLQELDGGEVLACKAALNFLSALLHTTCSYNFDQLDIDDLFEQINAGPVSINEFLAYYVNFFTPLPDAGVQLAAAKSSLEAMVNNVFETIDFIQAETDDQDDDFITIDSSDPDIEEKIQNIHSFGDLFLACLNGPTQIIIPAGGDDDDFDRQMTVDLSEFFNQSDPINLRDLFPQFDENNEIIRSSFPDPSMGGMLPDMSQADWNSFLSIGPRLDELRVVWSGDAPSVELNWGQEDDPDFSYYRVYRSTTPEDFGSWAQIGSDISDPGTTTFADDTVDETVGRVYYYRIHTYYTSETDATYSNSKRAVLIVYVDVNSASAEEDGSKEDPFKDLAEVMRKHTMEGTKICVAEGTYGTTWWSWHGFVLEGGYEATNWTRDIEAHETIINGTIGYFYGYDVVIDGFTVIGVGAGIQGGCSSTMVITHCKIIGNTWNGISAGGSPSSVIRIEDCIVAQNGSTGISVWGASLLIIDNCSITENGSQGIYLSNISSADIKNCTISDNHTGIDIGSGVSCSIQDCHILQNNYRGIYMGEASLVSVFNNLIANSDGTGIDCWGNDSNIEIINNTVVGNRGGIRYSSIGSLVIRNNNIVNNNNGSWDRYGIRGSGDISAQITHNNAYGNTDGDYSNCGTGPGSDNNISAEPLFVDGLMGPYYLSQIASGQGQDSPCVDAGSESAENLGFDLTYTTRTDEQPDEGTVDIGYHYYLEGICKINMTEMDWYENIPPYYSTGAATAQMILNYIREGAQEPLLEQDEIYEYARDPEPPNGAWLTADEVDKALGHFDPYDYLVSNDYDTYDDLAGGNPYQGYNFSVDTYDPLTNPEAINEYMRDICHWMAYLVTQENWQDAGELVARPNTPAAIPLYGTYGHWVAVQGFAASENPSPEPHTNPWNSPDFTVFGFWMKDPQVSGIGQDTYKTAAECELTYFQALTSDDAYNGLFLQVAEPPAEMSTAYVDIPKPTLDLANLQFIGKDATVREGENDSQERGASLDTTSTERNEPPVNKQSWQDLVDPYLLTDSEATAAFTGTIMGRPILVNRLDIENSAYYLLPFGKRLERKGFLTSAGIVLDAQKGYFKEAGWTKNPEKLLKVDQRKAISLIKSYILRNARKRRPIYTKLINYLKDAKAELVWQPNSYSPSCYEPYWKVDIGSIWYVTQKGDVIPEVKLSVILNE